MQGPFCPGNWTQNSTIPRCPTTELLPAPAPEGLKMLWRQRQQEQSSKPVTAVRLAKEVKRMRTETLKEQE